MDVYGGLKLKTSQIKEGKHERLLSHSLFLSVHVATEHEADSRLDPPPSASCLLCLSSTLVAGVRALCDKLAASSGWTLLLTPWTLE